MNLTLIKYYRVYPFFFFFFFFLHFEMALSPDMKGINLKILKIQLARIGSNARQTYFYRPKLQSKAQIFSRLLLLRRGCLQLPTTVTSTLRQKSKS
jgi:hypothetical protein